MEPASEQLAMYGQPSAARRLEWSWVQDQLTAAGTYWVVPRGPGHPHPRPVWGIWRTAALHLSIGSPVVARNLSRDRFVTVHLGSATDVVIIEGVTAGHTRDADVLREYDAKYEWQYSIDEYGLLTTVAAATVLAWRSEGWAGRDGFVASGRWRFATGATDQEA